MGINIRSEVFNEGDKIPQKHTCDDANISPPLHWITIPEHTISQVIICEDADSTPGAFTHWILFNIPADIQKIPAAIPNEGKLANGAVQGKNDFGYIGYGGPCPPEGQEHRYYFKIYALDTTLNLNPGVTMEELKNAMWGKVLDEGKLMGRYGR
ncbi:MAG: YbhB/YbcL family Raf kinase inhibitor-like protein [Methanobacterium sp.]